MGEHFTANFGPTSEDYGRHRAGFPETLFTRAQGHGIGLAGQRLLDLGTGTGTLARGFALRGATVTGLDVSAEMLDAARDLAAAQSADVVFRQAPAEATGLEEASFDAVTAGQCWHWFDSMAALAEVDRLLVAGGGLLICYLDWLPAAGSAVEATEKLIQAHNPEWKYSGGVGIHPRWVRHVANAGFDGIETFSFDIAQPYSHEAWRGRIRASAGVGGSLDATGVAAFDAALAALLAKDFPHQPLITPHRCWAVVCRKVPAE